MTIENKKIDQDALNHILANADKEDLAFIDCDISRVEFNKHIGSLSFERCKAYDILIDGVRMYNLEISGCTFTSLWIARTRIMDLVLDNFHVGNMRVDTATIKDIRIGENFTVDYCGFVNADVALFENLNRNAEITEDDLPRAFVEAIRYDSKQVLPEEGSFVAYKKVYYQLPEDYALEAIATLLIPEDAERVSPVYSRKCRASKAKVLSITTLDGDDVLKACSIRNPSFVYEVGKTVVADKFDKNIFVECSNGIHFFIKKKDAKCYGWR